MSRKVSFQLKDRIPGWKALQFYTSHYRPLPLHQRSVEELMEGFKKNTDKTWQDVINSTNPLR